MRFSCDLVIGTDDGRYFEWVLILRADSMRDAAALAEREVASWDATARIQELNLQEQESFGDEPTEPEVYITMEPREIGQPKRTSLLDWLKNRLGYSAQ